MRMLFSSFLLSSLLLLRNLQQGEQQIPILVQNKKSVFLVYSAHVNGHNWFGGYCDRCVEAAVEDCDHYNANPDEPIEGDFWLSLWCNWSCSQKISEACRKQFFFCQ